MPVIEGTTARKTAVALYDFAVDGGAISTITLRGSGALGAVVPAGSVVTGGFIDIETALVGATATIAAQLEGAGDLVAATAVASWSTGRKNILPADTSGSVTAATAVKTTVARNPAIVIATAALTAGKFRLVLEYV